MWGCLCRDTRSDQRWSLNPAYLRQVIVVILTLLAVFAIAVPVRAEVIRLPATTIVPTTSGKCLDVTGGSVAADAQIIQTICSGSASQQWILQPYAGAYRVINQQSGLCLNVAWGDSKPGEHIIQWPCAGGANELWSFQWVGSAVMLSVRSSGQCLNVSGDTPINWTDNDILIQWPCSATATNELFTFSAGLIAPQTFVDILSELSGQCVNVSHASTASGAAIHQYPCGTALNEQWTFQANGAYYQIVARNSGLCLAVDGASKAQGANVVQQGCATADDQLWSLTGTETRYQIVSKNSGQCLSVPGAVMTPSVTLTQQTCADVPAETWAFSPAVLPSAWSALIPMPIVPVGAANLPDGELLLWSSNSPIRTSGDVGTSPSQTYTVLLDPITGQATEWIETTALSDMFCPGTAVLPDGRILINGGSSSPRTSLYTPATKVWTADALMNIPRGYEADATLANGTVLTLGGSYSGGTGGKNGEIWSATKGWKLLSGVPVDPFLGPDPQGVYRGDNHFWLFAVSNGVIFHAGPGAAMHWINPAGNGTVTSAGTRGNDAYSINGNIVMYDIGQLLKAGGAPGYQNANATATAYTINLTELDGNGDPAVEPVAPMAFSRAFSNGVVLPTGQVVVLGGQSYAVPFTDTNAVFTPEIWDPDAQVFKQLSPNQTPRNYHSVAILLADGRIFLGGGGLCNTCSTNHLNGEILTPPYLLNADGSAAARPAITAAPATAILGGTLAVTTDSQVASFAIVRLSAVTHSINNDQRRIPLAIQSTPARGSYVLSIPADPGIVLPGNYMLFALAANGTPSLAKTIMFQP